MVAVRKAGVRWLAAWTATGVLVAGSAGAAQAQPSDQDGAQVQVALAPQAPAAPEPGPASRLRGRLSLAATPPLHTWGTTDGAVDLGLQWHQPLPADRAVDITAWRRIRQQPDALSLIQDREPRYGARFEMKIAPRRKGFTTDYKFIGLQLDDGGRIGLRRKDGRTTLYYRVQF